MQSLLCPPLSFQCVSQKKRVSGLFLSSEIGARRNSVRGCFATRPMVLANVDRRFGQAIGTLPALVRVPLFRQCNVYNQTRV